MSQRIGHERGMSDWREALHDKHGVPVCGPIAVGDGWRSLVEAGYTVVSRQSCLRVAQVKEKFGTLRFYVDHDYECEDCSVMDEWRIVEQVLELSSNKTCEVCGRYGRSRSGGWVKTLCDEHHEERSGA